MKLAGGIILSVAALFVATAEARDIRVRLIKHSEELFLEGEGMVIDDRYFGQATIKGEYKRRRWVVKANGQRTVLPLGPIIVDAKKISFKGQELPHHLHIHSRSDESFDVIGVLPLDEYIAGVVPNEMPGGWPTEALKAQTVAARSYAYKKILERQSLDFDVEATVLDQQFKYSGEPAAQKIASVVKETRGLVLLEGEKSVTEALYHADCGGMTESPDNVWGGKPELKTQTDNPHRTRHWQVEFERQSLVQKFTQYFGLHRTPNLRSLQAVGRSAGGRVKEIRVDLSDAGVKQISSQEFRGLVGYDKIPSANFHISWLGPKLQISGQGSGHGVGLCQLGARSMADEGKTFRDILSFYYPRSHLESLRL